MVTPSGKSTSMVMVAIAVPDVQKSSDLVPAVKQHLPGNVAHRRRPEKPQNPGFRTLNRYNRQEARQCQRRPNPVAAEPDVPEQGRDGGARLRQRRRPNPG